MELWMIFCAWFYTLRSRKKRNLVRFLLVSSGVILVLFLFVCFRFYVLSKEALLYESPQFDSPLFEEIPERPDRSETVLAVLQSAGDSSDELREFTILNYEYTKMQQSRADFVITEGAKELQRIFDEKKRKEEERLKKLNPNKKLVNTKYQASSSMSDYLSWVNSDAGKEDFAYACAMVHCEAGIQAPLESKCAVANVLVNRLVNQSLWKYSNVFDALYAPSQFAVVYTGKFGTYKNKFISGKIDADMQVTIQAMKLALARSDQYDIPDDVYYFYGDPNKRTWGSHTYCFTICGNSYFK